MTDNEQDKEVKLTQDLADSLWVKNQLDLIAHREHERKWRDGHLETIKADCEERLAYNNRLREHLEKAELAFDRQATALENIARALWEHCK